MLHMRDEAMRDVGPAGPPLSISVVEPFTIEQDPHIALQLQGSISVPNYTRLAGGRWTLIPDPRGLPSLLGSRDAKVLIRVPRVALSGAPQGIIIYGHGLLGSRFEILASHIGRLAQSYGYIVVAVDLVGMSAEDGLIAQRSVTDVDLFVSIGDRLHQGLLEYLLVSRAAREQLASLEPIASRNIQIDKSKQFYFGASQGGIFGVTFLALSQEITRGFLAVPGNNYNIMLQRSSNFAPFAEGLLLSYPDHADLSIILALLQLHWDRTDPVSYLHRLKRDPLPDSPTHDAIFALSKGDHQVSVLTNESASRSLGPLLPIMQPYDVDRSPWLVQTATYPHVGSGVILFDFGNPWPMNGNLPPNDGLPDPHPRQAEVDAVGDLMINFFEQGKIINICSPQGCLFGP
jgi:hypothetical protein